MPDWETTNVDFKRELHLDVSDDKAEFVHDVLALANTPVSGDRYLVVGWDPKAHDFDQSVDPAVTQDRLRLDKADEPLPEEEWAARAPDRAAVAVYFVAPLSEIRPAMT